MTTISSPTASNEKEVFTNARTEIESNLRDLIHPQAPALEDYLRDKFDGQIERWDLLINAKTARMKGDPDPMTAISAAATEVRLCTNTESARVYLDEEKINLTIKIAKAKGACGPDGPLHRTAFEVLPNGRAPSLETIAASTVYYRLSDQMELLERAVAENDIKTGAAGAAEALFGGPLPKYPETPGQEFYDSMSRQLGEHLGRLVETHPNTVNLLGQYYDQKFLALVNPKNYEDLTVDPKEFRERTELVAMAVQTVEQIAKNPELLGMVVKVIRAEINDGYSRAAVRFEELGGQGEPTTYYFGRQSESPDANPELTHAAINLQYARQQLKSVMASEKELQSLN